MTSNIDLLQNALHYNIFNVFWLEYSPNPLVHAQYNILVFKGRHFHENIIYQCIKFCYSKKYQDKDNDNDSTFIKHKCSNELL